MSEPTRPLTRESQSLIGIEAEGIAANFNSLLRPRNSTFIDCKRQKLAGN
jgi:hypothetical protein